MKPWKVRVDWICHDAYDDEPVDIELHVLDEEPKIIHREPTPERAVAWAIKFFEDRGFDYWCNIDWHQHEAHRYVMLHPRPKSKEPVS